MINVFYNSHYNIDLGLLNYLHPFDGRKFAKVASLLATNPGASLVEPDRPISQVEIEAFVDELIKRYLRHKTHIFRAIEVPNIPFVSTSFVDRKILEPMRWGAGGTISAATHALNNGGVNWNLAGGYHHASQHSIEGFCIYNDIGITYQHLLDKGSLVASDKVLIIDTDAHHGNGNARTFISNNNITILDVYNADIYPSTQSTRDRVDISVPLRSGTQGVEYLARYAEALKEITGEFKLVFVVAGTDVLDVDQLGGLQLSIEDVVNREKMTLKHLAGQSLPVVVLGGGGYSKASAECIYRSIDACIAL